MLALLPEGFMAVGDTKNHHFQASLNLVLGSASASIGLYPVISIFFDMPLSLAISTLMPPNVSHFLIGALTLTI